MKRLFSLIITLCMALCFSSIAFADDTSDGTNRTDERVSLEVFVEHWINSNYQDDVEVSRVVELYNPNDCSGQLIGHLVSFIKDTTPAGYVVLSSEEEDSSVIEFALEGECVYDWLNRQVNSTEHNMLTTYYDDLEVTSISSFSTVNEDVLYTDFVNYSLAVTNNEDVLLFNQYEQIQPFTNVAVPLSSSLFDGYVDVPEETASCTVDTIPGGYSKELRMDVLSPGANCCAPTASTNILNLYQNYELNGGKKLTNLLLNGDTQKTFDRLIALTPSYSSTDGVNAQTMIDSLKSYCKERGYTCSAGKYWFNYWSDYTRDIKKDLPIYLSVGDSSGGGHSQVVVGYREYENGNNYLRVFTGWSDYSSFVKFKASCFSRFNGWVMEIK